MSESFAWTWDGNRDCFVGPEQCLLFFRFGNLHTPIGAAMGARPVMPHQLVTLRALDQIR